MAYTSVTELLKNIELTVLLNLVNDETRDAEDVLLNSPADVATARILAAVDEADGEIDSYLRARYTLPLTTTPPLVKQLSRDICIYNLYKRRMRENIPESITEIYKLCVKLLEKIQRGEIHLGVEVAGVSSRAAEMVVNKTEDDRVFPKDMWDMW
jgi:phage gp36-like protein